MFSGSRFPNARPKLTFRPLDQGFLQIVCDLCRPPYIQNTRNFSQNLRRDIRPRAVSDFGPSPPAQTVPFVSMLKLAANQ